MVSSRVLPRSRNARSRDQIQMPRLRVEAGGRFVEHDQLRVVDQRAGDGEPALHAAGERVDGRVRAVGEFDEVEQFANAASSALAGRPK